jgi:hypothetical protein
MKPMLLIAIFIAVLPINGQKEGTKADDQQSHPESINKPSASPVQQEVPKAQSDDADHHAEGYLRRLFSPENLPNIGLFIAGIIGIVVAIGTLRHMRESAERQMRAYVVGENGTIFNVANPVPVFPGQIFEPRSEAEITNPAFGPGYKLQIKNSGQTPAYDVRHWGNILFREFPLKSDLPTRDSKIIPTACVLGPGISSTKFNYLFHPLTAKEVADLRAGNGAVYVYGEITYKDTFGKSWYTRYRLMHHASGGAIGVSTDLSFCESGNEAN